MLTAVTYARFSSDRQHESSIEAQHDAISAYAAQKHVLIVEQYVDRALSGKTDNRPEFQRLLSDLKSRRVDLVLVHKTDRFARNRYDAAIYSRVIGQRGARLVAVAQDFGDGPESVILEALMQGMAEYYSLNLAAEVIKGRKVAIAKGRHPGGTYPFGYGPDGQGGYAIVELEAYFVRKLYQAVIDGTPPYAQILDEMRAAGVRGRRGCYLSSGNVSGMLKLPIYAGIYEARAGDASSRIENNHPAIVSKEIYEEAVKAMEARQNAGRKPRSAYLLTGLVRCGQCGAPVYGHTSHKQGRTYATYVCGKSCGLRSIRAEELDQAARDYVAALLQPHIRAQLIDALTAYLNGQREQARRRVPGAKREIARLQAQIDAIVENMSSGVLPPSVLERMGKQITELEAQIEVHSAMIAEPPQLPPSMVGEYFAHAAELSAAADSEAVRSTLRRFILQIRIHPHSIEFESTFDGWLREKLPSLHPGDPAQLSALPPQGALNPKGDEPSACAVFSDAGAAPAAAPQKNASSPCENATPAPPASFSEKPTPVTGKMCFLNFQSLFSPTFLRRTDHHPHSGVTADQMLNIFDHCAQRV